jgi:hypothetical protein
MRVETPAPVPTGELAYPDGCASFDLSPLRCEAIVADAKIHAGLSADAPATVTLFAKRDDLDQARTLAFVVRVRVRAPGIDIADPYFCGPGNYDSLICGDRADLRPIDLITSGYHDTPCRTENGPCATELPSQDPTSRADARALRVLLIDVPIDHTGAYEVPLGQAVLANGVLRKAAAATSRQPAITFLLDQSPDLRLTDHATGEPLENLYQHGWRAGIELVDVALDFSVEWFKPGSLIRLSDVDVE